VVPQITGLLPIKPFQDKGWDLTKGNTFAVEGLNNSTMKFFELVPRLS
jgi:hypothetical protein